MNAVLSQPSTRLSTGLAMFGGRPVRTEPLPPAYYGTLLVGEEELELLTEVIRHGREGIVGDRTAEEIGIHAVRGGDVVGDHTVMFLGTGERIEVTHKASSRVIYAQGSLRAARFLMGQAAGLYTMAHVLGFKA